MEPARPAVVEHGAHPLLQESPLGDGETAVLHQGRDLLGGVLVDVPVSVHPSSFHLLVRIRKRRRPQKQLDPVVERRDVRNAQDQAAVVTQTPPGLAQDFARRTEQVLQDLREDDQIEEAVLERDGFVAQIAGTEVDAAGLAPVLEKVREIQRPHIEVGAPLFDKERVRCRAYVEHAQLFRRDGKRARNGPEAVAVQYVCQRALRGHGRPRLLTSRREPGLSGRASRSWQHGEHAARGSYFRSTIFRRSRDSPTSRL